MSRHLHRPVFAVLACISAIAVAGCGGGQTSSGEPQSTDESQPAMGETAAAAGPCNAPFVGSPESGLPTEYPTPHSKELTVGLLNPNRATEVLTVMYDAAKSQIAELRGTAIELDAKLNPDLQVSQFEQLLNKKVDAIGITALFGPNVLGPLLEKAAQAGIPIVALELTPGSSAPVPGIASQVWQQRDRITYLQLKAACEALPQGSDVALIGLALPVPIFQFMAERQRYWAEEFGLRVIDEADSDNDTVEGGTKAATGLLAQHPDVAAILGYNDEPAIGAALAARAAGLTDVKTFGAVAGTLGRGAIENGRLTASVSQDPVDQGRKLAIGLYAAAEGMEIPPVVLSGDPYIVTVDNVGDVE